MANGNLALFGESFPMPLSARNLNDQEVPSLSARILAASMAWRWLMLGSAAIVICALAVFVIRRGIPSADNAIGVYCDSNLAEPVRELCANYQREYGITVRITVDDSDALLTQLAAQPAGGDLFISIDRERLAAARRLGLATESIPLTLKHPVIVFQKGNPKQMGSLADLFSGEIKLALVSADAAPLGKVVQQALEKDNKWQQLELQSRMAGRRVSFVSREDDVIAAVISGAADAGIVWDTTAAQTAAQLDVLEVSTLRQRMQSASVAVLAQTERPRQALHLARYLAAQDRGQPVFVQHLQGAAVDADTWAETPQATLAVDPLLRAMIEPLVAAFEQREGAQVKIVGVDEGQRTGRGANGTPDALFAADVAQVAQTSEELLPVGIVTESELVLLVAPRCPLQITQSSDLLLPELRVGLDVSNATPLGRETQVLLKAASLEDQLFSSTSASDAADLVAQLNAGELDVVIAFRAQAVQAQQGGNSKLQTIELTESYPAAEQMFAVSRTSPRKQLMRRLLDSMQTPAARAQFEAQGFRWRGATR